MVLEAHDLRLVALAHCFMGSILMLRRNSLVAAAKSTDILFFKFWEDF